jgi:hypothetical protein
VSELLRQILAPLHPVSHLGMCFYIVDVASHESSGEHTKMS